MIKTIDNVKVTINGDDNMSDEEIKAYIDRGREQKKHMKLLEIEITADGDEVDLKYRYEDQPFERIRRITGYLVGTLDRFNNAKRAEVNDRVKHTIQDDCEDVYI